MITPFNVLRHELNGLPVEVVRATDPGHAGVKGQVVDETRDTIKIRSPDKTRTIPKTGVVLKMSLPEGCEVEVDGNLLVGRPEDRIKKKIRINY